MSECEVCGLETVKDMFCTACGTCRKCNQKAYWVDYSNEGDGQYTHCLACESKPVDSQVWLEELGNIHFQKEDDAKIFVETFWKQLRVPSFEQLRGFFCSFVEEELKAHVKKKKMMDSSDLVINLITFNCLFKKIMIDFEKRFRYDNEEHGPHADVPCKIFDTKFVDRKRFWGSGGSNSFFVVYTTLYFRAFQLLLPWYYKCDERFEKWRSKDCNFGYDCARLLLLRFREYYLDLCIKLCWFWNDVKNYPVKVRLVKTYKKQELGYGTFCPKCDR